MLCRYFYACFRTLRRQAFSYNEELLAPTYRVGIYCRLSKEDEDLRDGESQSIAHQREIIEEFCKRKGV